MTLVVRIADMSSGTIDDRRAALPAERPTLRPLPLMRRYADAVRRGDWETGLAFLAKDVVVHLPGRFDLAGERRGRAAVRSAIEAAVAQAQSGRVRIELSEMLASDERVALTVKERFCAETGLVEVRRCSVYRICAGEIVEVWIFEADQYVVGALSGAETAAA